LRYPPALERAGVSGTVVVEFVVDTAGQAERAGLRVVSSTRSEFESAAMEAVLGTRFRSAQVRGSAVRQLVRQRLSFVAP